MRHTRQLAAGDTWPGISCHLRGGEAGAEWEWDEEAGEYRRAARPAFRPAGARPTLTYIARPATPGACP